MKNCSMNSRGCLRNEVRGLLWQVIQVRIERGNYDAKEDFKYTDRAVGQSKSLCGLSN